MNIHLLPIGLRTMSMSSHIKKLCAGQNMASLRIVDFVGF